MITVSMNAPCKVVQPRSINGVMAGGNRRGSPRRDARARYYCENCGAEVREGASSCPKCGSRFTAVRCPECGYQGREAEFRSGCPVCGYLMAQPPGAQSPGAPPSAPSRKKRFLPAWFYTVMALALLAAVVVLLIVLLART
jgi:uncharacterized membrane protein YvbJ